MLLRCSPRARVACVALGVSLSVFTPTFARSQSSPRRPAARLSALYALDAWVVSRYRRTQLLPDSVTGPAALGEERSARIESVADAPTGDSLFAVQFRTRRESSSLHTGATIRLTGPTGSITAIQADIVARRPFRAPRRPGADTLSVDGWRYGWAYLALVRARHATTPASSYRGWVMLDIPDTTRRR